MKYFKSIKLKYVAIFIVIMAAIVAFQFWRLREQKLASSALAKCKYIKVIPLKQEAGHGWLHSVFVGDVSEPGYLRKAFGDDWFLKQYEIYFFPSEITPLSIMFAEDVPTDPLATSKYTPSPDIPPPVPHLI